MKTLLTTGNLPAIGTFSGSIAKTTSLSFILLLMLVLTSACTKDDCPPVTVTPQSRTFKVLIENVSQPNTLPTDRAMGTAPLSHGVYAIYSGTDPLFRPGQMSDEGTERIAEDGVTTAKTNMLNNTPGVTYHGEFVAPGGPDSGSALFAGESSMFMLIAKPGDKFNFESMFVQSNDWFYSFPDGGLSLFDGNNPISGNMTSRLVLYDAGTEADDAPGTGPYQKPVQDPLATNVGPDDAVNTIETVASRHPGFTVPATASVIRITITPQ